MAQQGGFEGLGFTGPTDRLFLAVLPDADVAARAIALADRLKCESGLRAPLVPAARLHVTLHYFGEFAGVPRTLLRSIDAAMQGIANRGFAVCFDQAWSFSGGSGRKPWVFGMSADGDLRHLHADIGQRLAASGSKPQGPQGSAGFVPHMTMLYGDAPLDARALEPLPLEVRDVALVDSLVGRGEYRVLQRWPLAEGG
jgi:2'-5' RNA ligase